MLATHALDLSAREVPAAEKADCGGRHLDAVAGEGARDLLVAHEFRALEKQGIPEWGEQVAGVRRRVVALGLGQEFLGKIIVRHTSSVTKRYEYANELRFKRVAT